MTEPRMSSDQKADNGQWSIRGVLRDMGPAGLPGVFLFMAIIVLWAMGSEVSYSASFRESSAQLYNELRDLALV